MNKASASPRTSRTGLVRLAVTVLTGASILFSSACSTLQGVAVPAEPGERIALQVGDDVQIQTKDGRSLAFKVTQIEPEALAGKNIRVAYHDIAAIQVKRPNRSGTMKVTAAVVVVVLVGGLLILLSHGVAFMPPGPS